MGIHDTLILDPPVVCPHCGKVHSETQTSYLSESLSTWRKGDVVAGTPMTTGIFQEELFCCRIGDSDEWTKIPIYVVIWHSIYAGYALSEDEALKKLHSTDRLDLLKWLEEAQQNVRDWRSRYRHLRSDIEKWIDAQKTQEPDEGKFSLAFRAFHALPDEILNDPDPLSRILERNDTELPAPKGFFKL